MKPLTSLVVGALATCSWVALGGPAHADSADLLEMSSFSGIVVDQAHGRVFVSGGILVTADLSGTVTGAVSGITAAKQIALTADGSQLVVANGDGLTVVDAATATVVRTIPTGPGSCPDAVAPASGLMFFTYGTCNSGSGGVGAVNLANDHVTTGLMPGTSFSDKSRLVPMPAKPSKLAAQLGDTLKIIDTTGGTSPTASQHATSNAASANLTDIAVSPDGTEVITASGGIYHHQVFSTTDLSHVGDYATTSYPNAVAVRSDGLVAAGADAGYDPDVWLFDPGAGTARKKFDFGVVGNPGDSGELQPRGLAFGEMDLYAVTGDVYGDVLTLRTLSTGPKAALTIATNHSSYPYDGTASLTVHLASPTTSRSVSVYATPTGGSRQLVRTADVDTDGRLVVQVANLTRNTTFAVTFAGDDAYSSAIASRSVAVAARITLSTRSASGTSGGYHVVKAGTQPIFTGLVSPSNAGACVKVVGQVYNSGRWVYIPGVSCAHLSAASHFSAILKGTHPRGYKVRIGAKFLGSSINAPTATLWYDVVFR